MLLESTKILKGKNFMETKVFISYSWDGEEHQEWVEQLATKLEEEELEITFDKKLNYGENLETFYGFYNYI